MFERFRRRSYELEHLDLGDYTADEYEGCMVELRRVNRWLGDASALRRSVLTEIEEDGAREFSLLDVGAGTGELLRETARWARARRMKARLVGLELNERAAEGIAEESREFAEVSAVRADALRMPFDAGAFDYCLCSLFTHHFRDESVVALLREMSRVARRRVYVIDLHRHRWPTTSTRPSGGSSYTTASCARTARSPSFAPSSRASLKRSPSARASRARKSRGDFRIGWS